ncbi:hypothetical protein RN001_006592 [Aquatica leii]|uniref:Gustatory receptor n=1 Tax=Aquatica leii TaxID=1421715 RepID=A0AAN7SQ98_9COLE|nr:hypothetical protein RN001_006592 [Aquatica leii]
MKVKKSRSGSDEICETKWELFSALEFMFRHTEDTRTTNSMLAHQQPLATKQPLSQALDKLSTQSNDQLYITSTHWPLIQPRSETLASATSARRPTSKKRKTTDNSIELQEQAAINRCMVLLSSVTPRDEFSSIGEYVCNELRLLSTAPDIQFKLKSDIQQLILNAGLKYGMRRFRASSAPFSSTHNSAGLLTLSPLSSQPSTPNSENEESHWDDQRHSPQSDLDNYLTISKAISRQDPSTDVYHRVKVKRSVGVMACLIYLSNGRQNTFGAYVGAAYWICVDIMGLVMVLYHFVTFKNEARKTVRLMEDLERAVGKSNLPYKQVELFSLQVYVEDFKFSIYGCFPLDWTLLHSMVAGVATYLVIFHQFSNMEKNAQST